MVSSLPLQNCPQQMTNKDKIIYNFFRLQKWMVQLSEDSPFTYFLIVLREIGYLLAFSCDMESLCRNVKKGETTK